MLSSLLYIGSIEAMNAILDVHARGIRIKNFSIQML